MLRLPSNTVRLLALAVTMAAAARGAQAETAPLSTELDRLAGWMSGSVSRAAQAAADTSYFDIHLRMPPAGGYAGSTIGLDCESDLRGAAYATSEVSITKGGIVSWDRGFDASGVQVWGAERGGYRFLRVSE
ncbi:MAG: hypothetical protein IT349_04755 [Candidatus Eisenbacteria bacterium]|nr:hypothetical protein [Candidatus Eisenbacteria bacterium]MCC7141392.1 hypothetical protein [Candidatus Eisenbacteria bacterium]